MPFRPANFLLLISLCIGSVTAANLLQYQSHFQEWYPGWITLGPQVLSKCEPELELYLTRSDELYDQLNPPGNRYAKSAWVHPLLVCMLQNTDELVKVEVSISNVILGLLPTTLVFVSSSSIEFGLLAQCRPLLSLLLAAASPGFNPLRRGEYYSNAQFVLSQPEVGPAGYATRAFQPSRGVRATLVSLLEYVLALAAIVNIVHNTWQLSVRTVSAYSPETAIQPILWATIGIVVHLLGMRVLAMRLNCKPSEDKMPPTATNAPSTWPAWLWNTELQICSLHPTRVFVYKPETVTFRVVSWMCNKVVVIYIIWGTFFFSSILLVKPSDALLISLRYLASVILSRLILQYELDGMSMTARIPSWMES